MFVFLIALVQAIFFSIAFAQYIDSFELYNAKTNKPIRNLTDLDIVTENVPLAIVARAVGAKSVTFRSPMFRRDLRPPYSLSEKLPGGKFKPVPLPPGEHVISASVDDERYENSILVRVQPDFPSFGPLPDQVVPKPLPKGDLPIPDADPSCKRKGPPRVFIEEIENQHVELYPNDRDMYYRSAWCEEHRVRIRFIEWERSRDGKVTTIVLTQKQEKYHFSTSVRKKLRCKMFYFFFEACVMKREADGKKKPFCSTSRLRFLPALVAPEPGLRWRPPFFVKLAPGDSAVLKTVTNRPSDYNNINGAVNDNGVFDDEKLVTNVIRGVFDSRKGKTSYTPWTRNKSVSTRIPLRKGGVTLRDNGSLVYVSYTTASCRTSTASWKGLWDTKVIVSKKHGSLVKQDTTFPVFELPEFPPTRINEPAEITVEAENPGGGMREGGKPVQLHYQWYLETQSTDFFKDLPEAIRGATQKTLKIDKAKCDINSCFVTGCSGFQRYYVDVCNTFGCRRSKMIIPKILPPAFVPEGKKWDPESCRLVRKKR